MRLSSSRAFIKKLGAGPAWLDDWAHRIEITIDHNDVDALLTWFPVLLYLSVDSGINSKDISCIFDEVGANSLKIAVTEDDGETQLYVQVDKWDNGNEEAWLWVSKDGWEISSTEDTTIFIYYDNGKDDNTTYVGDDPDDAPSNSVWNSSYKMVQHMRDNPDNEHIKDSTSNNNEGTKGAAGEPTAIAATTIPPTSDYQDFDGGDYIDVANISGLEPSHVTLGYWFKAGSGSFTALQYICSYFISGLCSYGVDCSYNSPYDIWAHIKTTGGEVITDQHAGLDDGAWHYVVMTYNKSLLILYVDGVLSDSVEETNNLDYTDAGPLEIGAYYNAGDHTYHFTGEIDEIRISEVARSVAWISANWEAGTDGFVSYGDEESPL